MPRPTKLSASLSAEELQEFFLLLAKEPNLTGERIQELAAEKGIEIGHNSAAKFKRQEFGPWLQRLQRQRTTALFINEHSDPAAGVTIADAVAADMSQDIFELQQAGEIDLDLSTPEGIERAEALSRIVKSLRSGDRAMQKELRDVQRQLDEIKKTVAGASKTGGGLSAEALRAMEEQLGWKAPEPKAEGGRQKAEGEEP